MESQIQQARNEANEVVQRAIQHVELLSEATRKSLFKRPADGQSRALGSPKAYSKKTMPSQSPKHRDANIVQPYEARSQLRPSPAGNGWVSEAFRDPEDKLGSSFQSPGCQVDAPTQDFGALWLLGQVSNCWDSQCHKMA
jgi:hypothetical protein